MQHILKPAIDFDRPHSQFSPSGSSRWLACPGSIQLEQLVERQPAGFYAAEGTAAHTFAADCLETNLDPNKYLGRKFGDFTVDQAMVNAVRIYIDYIHLKNGPTENLWVETTVPLQHIHGDMFGTADAIIFSGNYFEIIDYKHGKGVPVEVEENSQLKLYAIGALAWLAKAGIRYSKDFEVVYTIVQPRAPHHDGPIRSSTSTIGELRDFQETVKLAICNAESNAPLVVPGESQCLWCPAKAVCKAFAKYSTEEALEDFSDLVAPNKTKLRETSIYSDDELAVIYLKLKSLRKWADAIEAYMLVQARKGTTFNDLKLVRGRSNRIWRQEEESTFNQLIELGIDEEILYKKKFITPPQLQKEVDSELWEHIEGLVDKPLGKLTLTSINDARPLAEPDLTVEEDFAQFIKETP